MNKEEMFLDELELISDEELSESLLKIIELLLLLIIKRIHPMLDRGLMPSPYQTIASCVY